MDKPPVRQAHPMMATPKPPTRITVSGGPKATPMIAMVEAPSLIKRIASALKGTAK